MNDYRNRSIPLASADRGRISSRRSSAPGYTAAPVTLATSSAGPGGSGYRSASGARASQAYDRGGRRMDARSSSRRGESPSAERSGAARGARYRAGGSKGNQATRDAARAAARSPRRSSSFMKYAVDNRIVQTVCGFVTGSTRPLFIALVVLAVVIGLYFPIRNLYVAYRTQDILSRQVDLREAYNEGLQEDVNRYLSQEGIEEAARSELDMVLPGETRIEVIGRDDADAAGSEGADEQGSEGADAEGGKGEAPAGEGDSTAADGSDDTDSDAAASKDNVPSTALEAEQAELAAAQEAPWYIHMLDSLFFFDGVEGQPKLPDSTE